MEKILLSVCYMVKNEAANLPKSLSSVKAAADELIVVDTGSADDTRQIAQRFGATVYDFPWQDDFSAPRNFAIGQARGTWILFLDADEYFPQPLNRKKLLAYLAGPEAQEAILLLRRNIEPEGDITSGSTDWCLRLFRNLPELRYQGRIHENITRTDNRQLKVAWAPATFTLLHTGYAGPLGEEKSRRNLQLLQRTIAEDGWQPCYDYYLMDCYYGLQDYEQALHHALAFLAGDCFAYGGESHIYNRILECMRALHRPDADMLPWAEEACRKYPAMPEFYAEQGMILCGMGKLPEARQKLIDSLLHYEEKNAPIQQDGYFSPKTAAQVAARLGEIAQLYNDIDEAALWFQQALNYCDNSPAVLEKVQNFLHWAASRSS